MLAQEIVADLEAALKQFREIAVDLGREVIEADKEYWAGIASLKPDQKNKVEGKFDPQVAEMNQCRDP